MAEYSKTVADGNYETSPLDYVQDDELLVTITLHEYRELVKADGWNKGSLQALRTQIINLENENNVLKSKLALSKMGDKESIDE